jgi:hypothetical protein
MITHADITRLRSLLDLIGIVATGREKPNEGKTIQSKIPEQNKGRSYRQWAGYRDINPLVLRSRQKFFLDIPFYRAHRLHLGWGRPNAAKLRADAKAGRSVVDHVGKSLEEEELMMS